MIFYFSKFKVFQKKRSVLPLEILSQYNFIIGLFILEPKLSELYSVYVNAFCSTCREEFDKALQNLKNKKAAGIDAIQAEL